MRVLSRSARDRERELDEEIQAHLALRAADLEARGMGPDEARAEALKRFGDLEAARQELCAAAARRDRSLGWRERVDDVRRDLSVALRRVWAHPGQAAISTVIFALGIGVTTVMFTIIDNVLLRPLPFPESHRLMSLQSVAEGGSAFQSVSMGNWYDWKEQGRSLQHTALYREDDVGVSIGTDVSRVRAATVAGAFFETLGVSMEVGRPFLEPEAQEGAQLAVVSEGFWLRATGGATDLTDQQVVVDGVALQVVGVMAAGLEFPSGVDLWIPTRSRPFTGAARNNINWRSLGRLTEGVSAAQAEVDLSRIADGIRESDPAGIYSFGVGVEPLRGAVVGDVAGSLSILMGAVLLVLLIACTNLMGLGFARARARTEEIAVRLSLGAGRRRLLQQLITEQLLLAVVGGAVGLSLAAWGTALVMGRLGGVVPRAHEVAFDLRIAVVGLGLSLAAGLLAGLAPAWRASRGDPGGSLTGTRTVRGGRGLPGASLVVAEIALTVLLLMGSGLLLRSMGVLVSRDLGFDSEDVITLDLTLTTPEYRSDPARVVAYWTTLLATLEQTPGVRSVGAGNWIPTGGGGSTFVEFPGREAAGEGAGYRVVSDAYFEAIGTPLLQGRAFGPEDVSGSQRVVIVNQSMAREFWPGESPLGKMVKAVSMESYFNGGAAPWLTVVGVVGDVRHHGFEADPRAEMFTLFRQIPGMATNVTAVVRAHPGQAVPVLAAALERARTVDPGLAVDAGLLDGRVRDLMGERRLVTSILLAFAAMALGLASLGVYGVLGFAVAARTREMAIRAALGAGQAGLLGLVLGSGLRVVVVGLLVGGAGGFAMRGVLDALLVGVTPADPLTLAVVVVTLTAAALGAALVPAWRAARMDPLEALRER